MGRKKRIGRRHFKEKDAVCCFHLSCFPRFSCCSFWRICRTTTVSRDSKEMRLKQSLTPLCLMSTWKIIFVLLPEPYTTVLLFFVSYSLFYSSFVTQLMEGVNNIFFAAQILSSCLLLKPRGLTRLFLITRIIYIHKREINKYWRFHN